MKINGKKTNIAMLATAALVSLSGVSAQAAVKTWTGTTSANWATGTNWGTTAPVTGDSLVFTSATGAGGLTLSDNLMTPATFSVAGITFNAGSGAYVINPATSGTNGFTLTGNIANNSTSLQTINDLITLAGATRTISATSGSITLGGGLTGFGNAADATFTAASGQTITVSGFTGSSAGNDGILINGAGNTSIGAISEAAATNRGFSLTQSGTGAVTLTGANNLRNNGNGASVVTLNSGTLNLANAAALSTGTGTNTNLIIAGGTLDATGGVTALTYTGNAATQAWNGDFTFTGSNSLNMGNGVVTVSGKRTVTVGANTLTVGVATGAGAYGIAKAGAGNLTFGGVNITGGGSAYISDSAGSLALGTITRAAGGTLSFSGSTASISYTPGAQAVASGAPTGNLLVSNLGVAYATANGGADWATVPSAGTIGTLATYQTAGESSWGATDNVALTGGTILTNNRAINTLKILTTTTGQSLVLDDGVAGPYQLSLAAGGLLFTGANDYSISSGTLKSTTTTNSDLVIHQNGSGALTIASAIVNGNGASTLTKTGTGTLILSGNNTYTGANFIDEGTVKLGVAQNGAISGALGTGSGALTMGAGTTLDLQGNNVSVGGVTANFSSASVTVTSATAATLTVGANSNIQGLNLSGAASILYTGAGTNSINTGTTLITGTGSIGFQNTGLIRDNQLASNLGANGSLLFNGGGQLQNTTGQTLAAGNAVVINGTGNTWNYQATTSIAGAVSGNGSLALSNGFNPAFTFSGDLSGFHGTMTLNGSGANQSINFTNATTFSNDAKWALNQTNVASTAGQNSFFNYVGTGSKTIILGELSSTIAGAGGVALSNNTAATTATWQIGGANTSSTYSGIIQNGTGTSALTKVGTGALTLSGINTFTGATNVNGGTLLINGSLAAGSAVSVNSGGALGGSGTINGLTTVASGGVLGSTDGLATTTLTFSNTGASTLDISAAVGGANTGALVFELGASGAGDKFVLSSTGTLNIGTGVLNFDDFSFTALSGFGVGTYTLFDTSATILGSLGSSLTGSIGAFSGTLSSTGQDILLTVAVPEPSTYALLGTGLLSLWALRRKKKV